MIRYSPDLSIVGASQSSNPMLHVSGKAMGHSSSTSTRDGSSSGAIVPERIIDFLRKQHPIKTSECVSASIGISENTIKKWFLRESMPNGLALLKLVAAYGPEFLADIMPHTCGWLSEAARLEKMARLHAEIEQRKQALGELQQ